MITGQQMSDAGDGKHGVQSLEIGMTILRAMVKGHRSMMLKDIAAAAGMTAPKVHRYLVSLVRAGLVEQDPLTSRYDLGPFALRMGLVAIDRMDRLRFGLAAIAELRDRVNETTALAIWGDMGPVIVRWERPRRPVTVNVMTGVPLRLLNSAAGRAFAAWLPKARTSAMIAQELKTLKLPERLRTRAGVDALLASIRAAGIAAISDGYFAAGVEAMAAPVFNFKDEVTMALVVVGVKDTIDLSPHGALAADLRAAAHTLSERLGSSLPGPDPAPAV